MKTLVRVSLFAVAAFALTACAPPANTNTAANTNTNTNTNTAPKAAAPSADSLMAMENKAFEAWKNKDAKYFEGFMADSFRMYGDKGKVVDRAESIKMISEHKCDIKSFTLSEPHITAAGPDVVVLTYKAVSDGTCEGMSGKLPSPVTGASVYVRSGDAWKAAYHNEVAIVDPPKGAADTTAAPSGETKKEAAPATTADVAKKEAPAANKPVANTNTAGPSTGDALTDAIMAVERKGWDAWMKKDAKGLEETTAKDLTFVDTMGKATMGQANVIKMWTDGPCKVSSVNVSDGKATMLANNVAMLTFKGAAQGTCGTMKIPPLFGTTIAIKEGDMWKAVYIFETPAV